VYGETPKGLRTETIAGFKDPKSQLRILTAHPKTLGTGQNFQVAQTEIFYSNGQSSIRRNQCEDRCHRIGQLGTVNIYDLIGCKNDKATLDNIKEKRSLNDSLLSLDAARLAEVL
jgi:SNF2 family DNA or RNA helicase